MYLSVASLVPKMEEAADTILAVFISEVLDKAESGLCISKGP
jgi:hypothetical protein